VRGSFLLFFTAILYEKLRIGRHTRSMVLTLIQLEGYIVSEVENLHLKVDSIFDRVLSEIAALHERFNRSDRLLNDRVDALELRMENIEARIGNLERRVDAIEGRLDTLDGRLNTLEKQFDVLDEKIDCILHHLTNPGHTFA